MNDSNPTPDRSFIARFGATIVRGGIASIPYALYRYQGELKLTAQQTWFVSAILARKWDSDMPMPSLKRMAEQSGMSRTSLHAYQKELVAAGWLNIINRQNDAGGKDTNIYDFEPLFRRLEELLIRDKEGRQSSNDIGTPHVQTSEHTHVQPPEHAHVQASEHLKESVLKEPVKERINSSINRLSARSDFDVDNSGTNVDKPHRKGSFGNIAKRQDQEPKPDTTFVVQDDAASAPRLPGEMQPLGSMLQQGRGRPAKRTYDEDRVRIHAYIEDFAKELGDNAKIQASVSRAYNIYKASGKDIDAFCQYMYQAKHKTQERSSSIRTKREDGNVWAPKAKMSYWFKILENDLGLVREEQPPLAI